MLFQMDFLSYIISYLPTFLAIAFDIIILIFAIFIYKKNSYRYGIFLMLFAIISLVYSILLIAIGYQDLYYRLVVDLGLDFATASTIMMTLNLIFLAMSVTSTVFLVVAIIQIYKTHQRATVE
ncbi:MAG: hypothetical protein ACFE96_17550 [Candidatus Hermodarchaeota archaeon]